MYGPEAATMKLLLASAMATVLKLASDGSLPLVIRSIAALLDCALAIAVVVYVYALGERSRSKRRRSGKNS
jgi:hypothetical protein